MVLDTNIFIALLNEEKEVVKSVSDWKQEGRILFVSPVSTAEVLAFSPFSPKEIAEVRKFFETFVSVAFDNDLAEITAGIRRVYKLRLPDAIIAATALNLAAPLVTRDRQFRKIKEITVVTL